MVKVDKLKGLDIFSVFSGKQLESLAEIIEKKSYKTSAQIYVTGEKAKHLFIMVKGLVSLRELKPGDDIGVGFEMIDAGDIFGCASIMEPQNYTLTAVCLENTEVLSIDADKLLSLCEIDFELGYRFMRKVAKIYMDRFDMAKTQIHEMVKTPTVITALPG